MLLHHMITIILISNQYLIDQNTIGSVTLFLHDVSDFSLFLARICNDYKVNSVWYQKLVMGNFLASWMITRLIYFPISIILPTATYSFSNLFSENITVRLGCRCLSFQMVIITLLFFMHIYWFVLFVRIIYNKLAKQQDFNDSDISKQKKQ